MRLVIEGPLPPRDCSPNGYKHWRKVSKAKREQREGWHLLTLEGMQQCRWRAPGRATATIEVGIKGARGTSYYAPHDEANALAALKGAIDGIVDAGALPDDSRKHLSIGGITITADAGPWVRITLEAEAPGDYRPGGGRHEGLGIGSDWSALPRHIAGGIGLRRAGRVAGAGGRVMEVWVRLQGCDGSTDIKVEVTEGEFAFLERLERDSRAKSSFSCEPVLYARRRSDVVVHEDEDGYVWADFPYEKP